MLGGGSKQFLENGAPTTQTASQKNSTGNRGMFSAIPPFGLSAGWRATSKLYGRKTTDGLRAGTGIRRITGGRALVRTIARATDNRTQGRGHDLTNGDDTPIAKTASTPAQQGTLSGTRTT